MSDFGSRSIVEEERGRARGTLERYEERRGLPGRQSPAEEPSAGASLRSPSYFGLLCGRDRTSRRTRRPRHEWVLRRAWSFETLGTRTGAGGFRVSTSSAFRIARRCSGCPGSGIVGRSPAKPCARPNADGRGKRAGGRGCTVQTKPPEDGRHHHAGSSACCRVTRRDGNEGEVRRLIHDEHTSIVHAGAHAADAAAANGHDDLAIWLRELWTSVYRCGGYDIHNALQAQRVRWVILRDRFTKRSARRNFAQAALSDRERRLVDWLLVGTNDVCPDDPFSVIMGYYC